MIDILLLLFGIAILQILQPIVYYLIVYYFVIGEAVLWLMFLPFRGVSYLIRIGMRYVLQTK
jgi:hypothetical protein